jgi:hypothetical protein
MDIRVRGEYSVDSLLDREGRGDTDGFSLGELCGERDSSGSGLTATLTMALGRTALEADGAGEREGRGHLRGEGVVDVRVREERDKGADLC